MDSIRVDCDRYVDTLGDEDAGAGTSLSDGCDDASGERCEVTGGEMFLAHEHEIDALLSEFDAVLREAGEVFRG